MSLGFDENTAFPSHITMEQRNIIMKHLWSKPDGSTLNVSFFIELQNLGIPAWKVKDGDRLPKWFEDCLNERAGCKPKYIGVIDENTTNS